MLYTGLTASLVT